VPPAQAPWRPVGSRHGGFATQNVLRQPRENAMLFAVLFTAVSINAFHHDKPLLLLQLRCCP